MSKSGSSKGKHAVLILKELHLTPLYIYMIKQEEQLGDASFSIQMQKDEHGIAETGELTFIEPTELTKYPALEFNNVRFIFNVKTLFKDSEMAKIKLKLKAFIDNQSNVLEQFEVHLLEYSYEHSRQKFVTHKENSMGRIRKYILHYSFSAIYDKVTDQPQMIMKYGQGIKEEDSGQGSSVFDIVIKGAESNNKKKKEQSTLVVVQNVVNYGLAQLHVPGSSQIEEGSQMSRSILLDSSIKEAIHHRKSPRSIIMFNDDPVRLSQMSNITEHQIAEQIKEQSSTLATWLLVIVSLFFIYILMHPNRKV